MNAKVVTGLESPYNDENKWDLLASFSDQLQDCSIVIGIIVAASLHVNECTADLLTLNDLVNKLRDYYSDRANALIDDE